MKGQERKLIYRERGPAAGLSELEGAQEEVAACWGF